MSLLMDALKKKAEEAKRQSEAAAKIEPRESPPAGGGSTEADTRGLPELPSRLELLDHEFHTPAAAKPEPAATLAPAVQPSKQPAADAQERERAAAQNVFVAKQLAQNRNLLIVGGMAAVLAAVGIGGWVWWEMQPKGRPRHCRAPRPHRADRDCAHCACAPCCRDAGNTCTCRASRICSNSPQGMNLPPCRRH
ncbi:MAG: hypothetical protein M5R42_10280 [Rhodocyclaceae bacterium]|nr:hypothetical protein [Rhodocyclaceae bacterium]